jgi:hypothetical protein
MPTSFTGLLLFVVLLLPGFAYQVGKERSGVERRPPPFRETVSIVAASVVTELAVLVVTWPLWAWALNVHRLTSGAGAYWRARPGTLTAWGLGLLLLACGLAYASTLPKVRGSRVAQRLLGPYPHESTMSAWWKAFVEQHPHMPFSSRWVGCILDDDSVVEGRLFSFNRSGDDTGDRDLILQHPIRYQPKEASAPYHYPAHLVCIPARRIVTLFVTYIGVEGAREPTRSSQEPERAERAAPSEEAESPG